MKRTAFLGKFLALLPFFLILLIVSPAGLLGQGPPPRERPPRHEAGDSEAESGADSEATDAPARPNDPSNTDFAADTESFPPSQPGPKFEELINKAGPADPITLQGEKCITADRVQLAAEYYKGAADKNTVPFILLHDKGGSRKDFAQLAVALAEKGYAVLVPDLRGHGESTVSWVYDFSAGGERPSIRKKEDYTVDFFTDADFDGIRQYDGLLWFQFLRFLHNSEKINLRRLVIVGAGFGGAIGTSWAVNDWRESTKRGRFTKSLVLLSPQEDPAFDVFEKMKIKPGIISGEVFVGNLESEQLAAAEKIRRILGKDKENTPDEECHIEFVPIKTEKQGTDLLDVPSFKIADKILEFIETRDKEKAPGGKWAPIK